MEVVDSAERDLHWRRVRERHVDSRGERRDRLVEIVPIDANTTCRRARGVPAKCAANDNREHPGFDLRGVVASGALGGQMKIECVVLGHTYPAWLSGL